jgi:ribosomal-protein-alanine N-acetyltransferase
MHSPSDAKLPRLFADGLLRRLHASDLASFQAYRSIPELGRFQGWSPMSESESLAFLDEMNTLPLFSPGEWVQLGIAELTTNRLIGDIGVFLAEDGQSAEVGFTLEPAAQGRGVGTAAVREAIQLLLSAASVQQVFGITDTRNVASIRLLERVGFQHSETSNTVFRGEPCSEATYILHRNDG